MSVAPTPAIVAAFSASSAASLPSSSPTAKQAVQGMRRTAHAAMHSAAVDPHHPNAHLLSSLAVSAIPAMSYTANDLMATYAQQHQQQQQQQHQQHQQHQQQQAMAAMASGGNGADMMASMVAAYYAQLQHFVLASYAQAANAALHRPEKPHLASPPTHSLQQQLFLSHIASTNPSLLPALLSSSPSVPPPSLSAPLSHPAPPLPSPDDPDHLDFSLGVVRCVCGLFHRDPPLVRCAACAVLQHAACMGVGKGAGEGQGDGEEYCCELCEPTAPVHVGREMMVRRKEAEWREMLERSRRRGGKREENGEVADEGKRRRRVEGEGSGRKRRRRDGEAVGGGLEDAEEAVLQQLTAMFRCEIDDGLFDSAADSDDGGATDETVATPPAEEQTANDAAAEETEAQPEDRLHVNGWERDDDPSAHSDDGRPHSDSDPSDADEDGPGSPRSPAPRVHHRRAMTDSEKDAAAAISLLSPRPPAFTHPSSVVAGRVRAGCGGALMSVSPHRTTSSPPSSSASFFASIAPSTSPSKKASGAVTHARPLDLLLGAAPTTSRRPSLSLPSSPRGRSRPLSRLSPRGGGPFSVSLAKALSGVLQRTQRPPASTGASPRALSRLPSEANAVPEVRAL